MKKYVAEMIGTIIGSSILFILAKRFRFDDNIDRVNGYHDLVPAFVAEAVFTFIFLLVVLGSTSKVPIPSLPVSLLVLIHIVCIPITGTSVNPARRAALLGEVKLSHNYGCLS